MKKILSFILALTLCIGLLPTFAFAADAEKFVVDFTNPSGLYLHTDNRYYFRAEDTVYGTNWMGVSDISVSTLLSGTRTVKVYPGTGMQPYFYNSTITTRSTLAFDITVPHSGVYDIIVNAGHDQISGTFDVYLNDTKVGSTVDLYENGVTTTVYKPHDVAKGVYIRKGTVRLKIVGQGQPNNTDDYAGFVLQNFTFTPNSDKFVVDFGTATWDADGTNPNSRGQLSCEGKAWGDNWEVESNYKISTILEGNNGIRFFSSDGYVTGYFSNANIAKENFQRDAMVFYFDVEKSGIYDISAVANYGDDYGIAEFFIDGNSVSDDIDFYASDIAFLPVNVAQGVYLKQGKHTLKILAKIQQKSTGNALITLKNLTFTKSTDANIIEPDTVSFAQTTNIAGFTGINVTSVTRGESVALTAHAQNIEGYKFIGWKRGADTSDENAWVDIDGDSCNVWTNTYLTAIYEPIAEENAKVVEFWNQNGAYLGQSKDAASYGKDVKCVPTLTGFGTFLGWFVDEVNTLPESFDALSSGTTNAVAKYKDGVVSNVTFNGNAIDGADTYNASVTLNATSDATTCWKRGTEIIAYGNQYKFNVWDATNITEGTDVIEDRVPVAILEYNEDYNAYMLEYDDGDYEIVEAGILFGKNMTVDSCDKKYTSQRKVSHNQFTVPKGDYTDVRGYIIWKDAFGAYRIEYYDAVQ